MKKIIKSTCFRAISNELPSDFTRESDNLVTTSFQRSGKIKTSITFSLGGSNEVRNWKKLLYAFQGKENSSQGITFSIKNCLCFLGYLCFFGIIRLF